MYDYNNAKIIRIENVDHQIDILGVKASAWPFCILGLTLTMPIHPLVGLTTPIVIGIISKKLYELEKIGKPIEFSLPFQNLMGRFPLLKTLFSDLVKIRFMGGSYRG